MQKLTEKKLAIALAETLPDICQLTRFAYGEIWLANDNNDFLELSPEHYIAGDGDLIDLSLFCECSQGFIMSRGEGLPGRVLATGKPEWILDVSVESEGSFLRNKIAGVCGIRTGFALPILKELKVIAVLAFFTHKMRPYSAQCLALAEDLTTKLSDRPASRI